MSLLETQKKVSIDLKIMEKSRLSKEACLLGKTVRVRD